MNNTVNVCHIIMWASDDCYIPTAQVQTWINRLLQEHADDDAIVTQYQASHIHITQTFMA